MAQTLFLAVWLGSLCHLFPISATWVPLRSKSKGPAPPCPEVWECLALTLSGIHSTGQGGCLQMGPHTGHFSCRPSAIDSRHRTMGVTRHRRAVGFGVCPLPAPQFLVEEQETPRQDPQTIRGESQLPPIVLEPQATAPSPRSSSGE